MTFFSIVSIFKRPAAVTVHSSSQTNIKLNLPVCPHGIMKVFIVLALVGVVTGFSLRNQLEDDNRAVRLKSKTFIILNKCLMIEGMLSRQSFGNQQGLKLRCYVQDAKQY